MATANNTLDVIIPIGSSRELERVNVRLGAVSFLKDKKKILIGNGYSVDEVAGVTGYGELDFKPKVNGKEVNGNQKGKFYGLVDDERVTQNINPAEALQEYVWELVQENIPSFRSADIDQEPAAEGFSCDKNGTLYLNGIRLPNDQRTEYVEIPTENELNKYAVQFSRVGHSTIFNVLICKENSSESASEEKIPSEKAVRDELDTKQTSISVYEQTTAATMWDILHNAKCYPNIKCVDNQGNEIIGEVIYVNENEIRVKYAEPESGKAYLS